MTSARSPSASRAHCRSRVCAAARPPVPGPLGAAILPWPQRCPHREGHAPLGPEVAPPARLTRRP
eukprot:9512622-Lingulodinium_polyedra.AAC.1